MSKSGSWTIALARDYVALDTRRFTRWEEFREYIALVLQSFNEVYKPPYITRIGIRYRNVIDRKRLGIEDTDWRDLIAPFVQAQLGLSETMEQVLNRMARPSF